VIPASPTTLITLLRTVQFGWRQERIAESAEEIRKLGQDLYDRLRVLAGHLGDVGKGLTRATEAYNEAVGSFESRALVGARKFAELGAGEGKLIVELGPAELQARSLQVES
jgi:DNA recombination protein RmuC